MGVKSKEAYNMGYILDNGYTKFAWMECFTFQQQFSYTLPTMLLYLRYITVRTFMYLFIFLLLCSVGCLSAYRQNVVYIAAFDK